MERFCVPGCRFWTGTTPWRQKELEATSLRRANYFEAKYWLAIAQRGGGRALEAESTVDSLLTGRPNDERALEVKSSLASDRNDWISAVGAQTKLVKLRPNSAAEQWSSRRPPFAIKKCRRRGRTPIQGLATRPSCVPVSSDLGNYNRVTGRNSERLGNLEWVVRFLPEADSKTYVSLALAFETAKDRASAQFALEKGSACFLTTNCCESFL